jgi:hypothetical protein
MIDKDIDALDLALALYSTPQQSHSLDDRPLASGSLELIRIVAGDEVAIANAQTRYAKPRKTVIEAAVLYIQQAFFHDSADSYRLLGANSNSSNETIKEHYRWLMRWLHPDRNPDRWVVAYSERVNRAWNSLNTPDRRRNYDLRIQAFPKPGETAAGPAHARVRVRHSSTRVTRRAQAPKLMRLLPGIILGGLSGVCALWLYLFDVQQSSEREASLALSKKIALQGPIGESSAQEEAIRRRIEFEEHVIELSQPVLPVGAGKPEPVGLADAGKPSTPQTVVGQANDPGQAFKAPTRIAAQAVKTAVVAAPATTRPTSIPDPKAIVRRALAAATTIAMPSANASPVPMPPAASAMPTRSAPSSAAAVATAAVSSVPTPIAIVAATHGSAGKPSAQADEPTLGSAAVSASAMSPEEATKVLPRAFEDAYAKGDLTQMMGLFSADAVNDRGGIAAISQDYEHLFHNSGKRDLRLVDLGWVMQPDRIVGNGSFEALIQHDGAAPTQARGWIQVEAILLNGHWKIHRLLHGNSQ